MSRQPHPRQRRCIVRQQVHNMSSRGEWLVLDDHKNEPNIDDATQEFQGVDM